MRSRLTLALSLLLALNAAADVASDAAIKKILADRIDARKQGVAIVVGVIEPSGRRVVAHGTLSTDDKRVPNGDTLFEIGSTTKVFTALLLADAVQRGEVKLDDPISKYLPQDVKVPERGRAITLRDLATHTSGLPRLPANMAPKDANNPYADYTEKQLYEFLSTYELPRDAGATYEYSNLGAGLLGHVIARRAGVDYEALVRKRIATPLAMKSTAITLTDALKKRLAPGHTMQRVRTNNWDLAALAGAGGLRSTVNDLLTLLGATMRYTTSPLTPAMTSLLASRQPAAPAGTEIGLGWHITKTPSGGEIVWHNGGTGGYRAWMGFDPKTRTGVVVLANMFTGEGVDDIGRHLLDPSLRLLEAPKEREEIAVDEKVLESYVGVYQLAPNFTLTVTRDGKQLHMQATGQPKFALFASSETEFFLKVVDAQVTFETDALVLHQNGADMPAKRVALAPKQRTEIAIDPALIPLYVGRYQLAPTFILDITRDGNHLFVQATAQPKFELFAETQRDFFLKDVDAQVTFVLEGPGPAPKIILHQGGVDQEATRIP
ncbi:MAG TPA: serine hydrolase [Thermoanaerobaculia bacterium]|nr:serine hydrolase [Thermoanaerobaculia bacterium]